MIAQPSDGTRVRMRTEGNAAVARIVSPRIVAAVALFALLVSLVLAMLLPDRLLRTHLWAFLLPFAAILASPVLVTVRITPQQIVVTRWWGFVPRSQRQELSERFDVVEMSDDESGDLIVACGTSRVWAPEPRRLAAWLEARRLELASNPSSSRG
jgi:hypothetical protein